MKKILLSIITITTVFILAFTGCTNSTVKKSIEQAKSQIQSKEYDKALALLELALNEDSKNEDANKLYSIVNNYKKAKGLVDESKFDEAKKLLEEINADYINYGIKEDIDLLKKENEDKLKQAEAFNSNLDKLSNLINEKEYDKANSLADEINKGSLSEDQKSKVSELKTKAEDEIAKIEAKKKEEAEAKKLAESKKKENENQNITEGKAISLVVSYLKSKGENSDRRYMIQSEDSTEYTIRVYDDMDTHISSSYWYTVNKKTGNVKSSF